MPFTINFPQFEAALSEFLHQRSEHPTEALENPPSACTLTWFGLLFSILACGAQLGSDQESELIKARVFGECPRNRLLPLIGHRRQIDIRYV